MEGKVSKTVFHLVKYAIMISLISLIVLTISLNSSSGNFITWIAALLGAFAVAMLVLRYIPKLLKRARSIVKFLMITGLLALDFSLVLLLLNKVIYIALFLFVAWLVLTLFFSVPVSSVTTRYKDSKGVIHETTSSYLGDQATAEQKARREVGNEYGRVVDQDSKGY